MADKWEYRFEFEPKNVAELNRLGEQGWELAGVVPRVVTPTIGNNYGLEGIVTTQVTLIFKRRKP